MALLTRIRRLVGRSGNGSEARFEGEVSERPPSEDSFEAEILSHDIEAVDADTFAAAGDGVILPTLPEATPSELFTEFDADQEQPPDEAP